MIEIFTETKNGQQYQGIRNFFSKLDTRLREMYSNGNTQKKRANFFLKKISSVMCIFNLLNPKKDHCDCSCKKSFLELFPCENEYIHFYYHGNDAFTPGEKIKIRYVYYSPDKESHIMLQKKISLKEALPNNLEPSVLADILQIIDQITKSISSTEKVTSTSSKSDKKTLEDLQNLLTSDSGPKSWDLTKTHDILQSTQILDNIKTDLSLVNVMLARDVEYSYSLPSGKQIGNLYRQFSEAFTDEDKVLGG